MTWETLTRGGITAHFIDGTVPNCPDAVSASDRARRVFESPATRPGGVRFAAIARRGQNPDPLCPTLVREFADGDHVGHVACVVIADADNETQTAIEQALASIDFVVKPRDEYTEYERSRVELDGLLLAVTELFVDPAEAVTNLLEEAAFQTTTTLSMPD